LDNAAFRVGEQLLPTWNSFWTGTRPVCWITGAVDGQSRCLHISEDFDGEVRLWDTFTPDRLDDGCPITWWVETRAPSFNSLGKNKEFRYADVFMSELLGRIDLAVFWAGSHRGRYKRVLTTVIHASRGSLRSGEVIRADDKVFELKKQSRPLRTQDGRALNETYSLSSCDVEAPNEEFKDEAFQLLIVGSGPAAVRGFVLYAEPPKNDDDSGRCTEKETEENFVRFDGAASESDTFAGALAEFVEDIPVFTSVRTATVTQDGMTEVASGESESVISQEAADYVAETIARRKASAALELSLPPIVSLGAIANELT